MWWLTHDGIKVIPCWWRGSRGIFRAQTTVLWYRRLLKSKKINNKMTDGSSVSKIIYSVCICIFGTMQFKFILLEDYERQRIGECKTKPPTMIFLYSAIRCRLQFLKPNRYFTSHFKKTVSMLKMKLFFYHKKPLFEWISIFLYLLIVWLEQMIKPCISAVNRKYWQLKLVTSGLTYIAIWICRGCLYGRWYNCIVFRTFVI